MKQRWKIAGFAILSLCCSYAAADSLTDLKSALGRYPGTTILKATVEAKVLNRNGEGKDQEEINGSASLTVEDGPRGLQMHFGRETLQRVEQEERAKEKDSKARSPVSVAMRELGISDLRTMTSSAPQISRRLEKAVLRSERQDVLNGKNVRVLNFEIPIDKLSEKDKKYIKKYDGTLEVWIDSDGTPLQMKATEVISGRAFVVISFEARDEEQLTFGVAGDRLVVLKKERRISSSGAGERADSRVNKSLQILS